MMDKLLRTVCMEQMNGKKNFIEALPDIAIILDKTTAFDEITMMSLISTLIDIAAAQAGVDPGELAHTILETVVAVNDEEGFIFKEVKE